MALLAGSQAASFLRIQGTKNGRGEIVIFSELSNIAECASDVGK